MGSSGTSRLVCILAGWLLVCAVPARAGDVLYLQLGAGASGEHAFILGGLIASALSNPPGLRPCGDGGGCGVPGLIVMASGSDGGVETLRRLGAGSFDAVLADADMAALAARGAGPFAGRAVAAVRALARVGEDDLQVVARAGSGLRRLADLKGRRVAVGTRGSAAAYHAGLLLAAAGLEGRVRLRFQRASEAADALTAGRLDAIILTDSLPSPTVAALAEHQAVVLLPVPPRVAAAMRRREPLLRPALIPAGAYAGQADGVPTLAVGLDLLVGARLPETLAEAMCAALWHPDSRALLAQSHASLPDPAQAASGLGVPLHPGARRYYADHGLLPVTDHGPLPVTDHGPLPATKKETP